LQNAKARWPDCRKSLGYAGTESGIRGASRVVADSSRGRRMGDHDSLPHSPQPHSRASRGLGRAGAADRNLLFGLIALQSDFLTREQLVAGFDAWVHEKSRSLAAILESQGALSAEDRQILESLVRRFLEKHGGDAEKSLAALSALPQVELDLERLNDPDLGASLAWVAREQARDPRLETTLPLPVGSSLGRFRVLRPHAKGGLGQVSVALDQELNREVALKEIQPQHADDVVARERFVVEAEITGGLEHPGIVPVYALGQGPDGRPFYAMRFVRGDSLKQAIESFHRADGASRKDPGARQLALRQLLGRFIDVCNAIEYAHSRGVLHRDLKPGNIMVGKYGETLVVDWGLAKSVGKQEIVSEEPTLRPTSALSSSGQTRPGSAIGTPAYMSPEQAAGKLEQLGPASDVYSLGATLYHLLCGMPPFRKDHEEAGEILQRVERGEFPRPRSVAPDVPAALEAICLKAMALKAIDRYPTARALADDLEHWLADEPLMAAPDSLSDRLGRLARKHRGYVRAGALSVIVVAIVSTVASILINKSRNAALVSAQGERDERRKAETLSAHNARLAKDEEAARVTAESQLRIATAERLAALSHVKRSESPELSLLLAVESGRATEKGEEGLLPSSHQALLDALAGIGGRPLIGHKGSVTAVAISPDNRWIVTGSDDNTARLWKHTEAIRGAKPQILAGHTGAITCVAISRDSRWIITGSKDRTARVWDTTAPNPAANPTVLRGLPDQVADVAISSDNRWLVTVNGDMTTRIWDITAASPTVRVLNVNGAQSAIEKTAISPDMRWIVTTSKEDHTSNDETIRLWDFAAENPAASSVVLCKRVNQLVHIAISANSRWCAALSDDKTMRIWDISKELPEPEVIVLNGFRSVGAHLAISSDCRRVVTTADDGIARMWSISETRSVAAEFPLRGHSDLVHTVEISPDGRWIVTASQDNTARLWDLSTYSASTDSLVLNGHEGPIRVVAISADSRWLITGSDDKTSRIWDLNAGRSSSNPRLVKAHEDALRTVAVSADGRRIATGSNDRTARIWSFNSKTSEPMSILTAHDGPVTDVAFSADNRWVVTGSTDRTVRIWDLTIEQPDKLHRTLGMTEDEGLIESGPAAISFCEVAINSDHEWGIARWVHRIPSDGERWDEAWDEVHPVWPKSVYEVPRKDLGHKDGITSIAISSDSRWVGTGSYDATVRVWSLAADGTSARSRVLIGHNGRITSLAISSDNRLIVSGSSDGTARVWGLTPEHGNRELYILGNPKDKSRGSVDVGHGDGVTSVAISPDNHWIVTGSSGKTAIVWDLKSEDPGASARILAGHTHAISRVAISPEGRSIVTCGWDRTLRVWDLATENDGVRTLTGHQDRVIAAAFTPDSRWLVSCSHDRSTRIWDLTSENPSAEALVLNGRQGVLTELGICPDGSCIVTIGENSKSLSIWVWQWDDLVELAADVGRNFDSGEWQQYFPGVPYRKTFPDLPGPDDP
jgi:eukaryotic-like serine/threonine-protein kinase